MGTSAIVNKVFTWWTDADADAHRAFLAAAAGWMLDSFDVMIYALVLPTLLPSLGLASAMGGRLQSMTLIAAAAGGIIFGVIADRWGRTRALMASVLLYSIFTAACGFANTALQLAVFRIGLGLGMGGEWASGAALVSEMWPTAHRGKALAWMQSAWAVGYALATFVNWFIQDVAGWSWRAVFFVGVIPALFTLWVRRSVKEPAAWHAMRAEPSRLRLSTALKGPLLGITIALCLMNAFALFAYWGFNTWVPSYLSAPVAKGGIGLSRGTMSALVVANNVGTWFGYVSFGYISDAVGRRRAYVSFLTAAAVLTFAYTLMRSPWALLVLGPATAFFATGNFSGFGTVTAELYPTAIRATLQGLTYNIGRVASAGAPWLVGALADKHGYPAALSITAAAFVCATVCWVGIPETKGRQVA
jgi:MFS family permease